MFGNIYGSVYLAYQISPFEFQLEQDVNNNGIFSDINVGYYSAPYFFDFDLDGDDDLIVGGQDRHRFYLNENNFFNETDDLEIPYLGKNVKFSGGNLFQSNHFDIISGISTGGLYFLSEKICDQGDLNQDEIINILDIMILVDLVLELQDKNSYFICSGDFDNNYGFNILDILNLLDKILEG